MDRWSEVAADLESTLGPCALSRDEPLAGHTSFGIGGPADLLVRVHSRDELADAVRIARDHDAPHMVIGSGANMLVGDGGFRGAVILDRSSGVEFRDDSRVTAESGVRVFPDLINRTVGRGLGGLHHYVGIPGTVGAAMWQNLHFLSPDRSRTVFIEEVVEGATILDAEGRIRSVGVDYFEFGYDDSILHRRDDIVLDVTFALQPTDPQDLRAVMRSNLEWRDSRHPDLWLYPCAGSVFKKLEGLGAGRLIDQVGLKGFVHPSGRAGFFPRHANIIVNFGGATARDVLDLIELAQSRVRDELGHQLEPEIGLVGEF